MRNIMKGIYIVFGFICLALCAVGAVLPILPSTPFLIVSAFCFAKGSEKANKWLQSTNLYKKHLDCFVKERSMLLKTKINLEDIAYLYFMQYPFLFYSAITFRFTLMNLFRLPFGNGSLYNYIIEAHK